MFCVVARDRVVFYPFCRVDHPTHADILPLLHSLRMGWRKLVRVSLIFAIIASFMTFTVFPLVYVLYFEVFLIYDSRGFMILKNN